MLSLDNEDYLGAHREQVNRRGTESDENDFEEVIDDANVRHGRRLDKRIARIEKEVNDIILGKEVDPVTGLIERSNEGNSMVLDDNRLLERTAMVPTATDVHSMTLIDTTQPAQPRSILRNTGTFEAS